MRIQLFHCQDYPSVWSSMQEALPAIQSSGLHEIWLGEHPSVYTLGQAGKMEHLIQDTQLPVMISDRGGQITYHGPGQIMVYTLLNLKQLGWGIRRLVCTLENVVCEYLAQHGIEARGDREAPGVYIGEAKVAAIGLRVRHGVSYHGMAINVDLDLAPYNAINPCGFANMPITRLCDHGIKTTPLQCGLDLSKIMAKHMGIDVETIQYADQMALNA